MTAKIKQKGSKLAMEEKNKETLTTFIEDIEYWECYKKSHFKSNYSRKKQTKSNI